MNEDGGWSVEVLEHFHRGTGAGTLARVAGRVGSGVSGAVSSGTAVRIDVRLDACGRIAEVAWQCYGCPGTQAACAWLAEQAPGRTADSPAFGAETLARVLGISSDRLGALVMVDDAFERALAAASGAQQQ